MKRRYLRKESGNAQRTELRYSGFMMKYVLGGLLLMLIFSLSTLVQAGVKLEEGVGDGTEDEWPVKTVMEIVKDPTLARAPAQVSARFKMGQSFIAKKKIDLGGLVIRYSNSNPGTFTLRLFELSEDGTVEAARNMLTEGLEIKLEKPTGGAERFLVVYLTEADQVTLDKKKRYLIELEAIGESVMNWHRRAADEYPDGYAYKNGEIMDVGEADRDLALALIKE